MSSASTRRAASLLALLALLACAPAQARAQQQLALELHVGRTLGATPYLRDVVYLEDTTAADPASSGATLARPYLADEQLSGGLFAALGLFIPPFEVTLQAQWYARDVLTLHHESEGGLISRNRLRSDNSVDDGGVRYKPLSPERVVRLSQEGRGDLMVASLSAAYRFDWSLTPKVSLFTSPGAGLALAKIGDPGRPYVVGAQLQLHNGAIWRFGERASLMLGLRMYGTMTPTYGRADDAARRAQWSGGSTLAAATSSSLQFTLSTGLVYTIR